MSTQTSTSSTLSVTTSPMTITERTPLRFQRSSVPLEERAHELLAAGAALCTQSPADRGPFSDLTHEFASTLYALHIVERHDRQRGSARAAAFRAAETSRTRTALRDHALAMLDAALRYGPTPEDADESDDDVLELSRALPVKGWSTSVAALLAHHTTPGVVLAHPLIRAALPRAWVRSRRSNRKPGRGLRAALDRVITPSRAHVFELVASLVYVALTFITALVPDIDVRPDNSRPTEIVWVVWSWASFCKSLVDAVSRRRGPSSSAHLFLLLPAQLAGMLMPIWERAAVLLRVFAIPCLTLSIVLPSAPSLTLLFPQRLLPLAIMLAGVLARGAKAAALLIPLAAALWALFAYALNGDVWRAGPVAIPERIPEALLPFAKGSLPPLSGLDGVTVLSAKVVARHTAANSVSTASNVLGNSPVEVGVAPFETRVALFITLVMVILLSVTLSILRAIAPSNELHDGTWEAEYGPTIGHQSRRALAAAVARYLPSSPDTAPAPPPLPVPLNVLLLPYDVLIGAWAAVRREPPYGLRRAKGWIALIIVAAPCALLAPIGVLLAPVLPRV